MKKVRLCERAARNTPPDAGASYLGTYTLGNEWTLWLLRTAPDLLALPPSEFRQPDGAPICGTEKCEARMVYRPGAWCCYRHDDKIIRPIVAEYEDATILDANDQPVRDVLSLINSEVDVMFTAHPGERPRWRAVKPEKRRR